MLQSFVYSRAQPWLSTGIGVQLARLVCFGVGSLMTERIVIPFFVYECSVARKIWLMVCCERHRNGEVLQDRRPVRVVRVHLS